MSNSWKGVIFFLVLLSTGSFAQNLAQHNWYFGNSVNAIRFNRATNKAYSVTDKAIPFGLGGSAVATDPATADLLFYSDGANVYNTFHVIMPNGSGLLGNTSANQPVVISPVPGDSTKYFLFTNSANYTAGGSVTVNIVDMTLFGGSAFPQPALGDLKNPKNVAIASLTNRSEGMTVVPHGNGKDYWLITHQNGSQNYSATLINSASYTAGTFTSIVTSGLGLPTSVANFSYSRKNKKLAVSAQDPKTDAIILTFNDATGALTFDRTLFNTGTNTTQPQSIYDIQWDNAGQYLYISRVGEPGINADVLQYDYNNPSNTLTTVLKAPIFRSWGLQLAPDSAIYHLYQAVGGGPFLVEKFTKTDTVASSVIQTPFAATNFNGTQFPSFIPKVNITLTLSFTAVGFCQNSNTTFFPNVFPNADSLHWDFGDTTSVTDWSPVHKFKQARTYTVTLTAFYQGKKQSVTQNVPITAFALKLQLVSDTTACRSEFPPPRGSSTPKQFSVTVKTSGGNPTSYNWSNGQTGPTLKPDSAGYYYVVVTDASGCSAYAGVNVKEYGTIEQRSNIWYFGNNAGIDFNKKPPVALNDSKMIAPDGCAIVCDRNGQTIFYTNGNSVWDRTHTIIATGIGGDSTSTQSSLIVPVPGDETLYYIFTTQSINGVSNNEMRYSLFDLKLNGGKGGIVSGGKDVLLFAKSTERITGNSQWVVAHEYGNNTFRAYRVTGQGLSDPVYSAIGSIHSFQFAANGEGYMKLGPNNNLAVAFSTPGTSNSVELFHLNDSTGMLSYYRKIDLKHPAGQVYGVEFSPGGNKLFASISDTPNSDIFEYSIDSVGRPHLKKDNVEAATVGALQIAPDNQIYFAINGSGKLGTINADEDTTKISPVNLNGFTLAGGTTSTLGLPNFRQQQGNGFGGPGFSFTGLCLGDSTKFIGTATDAIDKFQWFFGDGGGSTQPSPAHLYAAAGTYSVKMRLTNRCGLDTTITKQVKINSKPARPSIPPASVICNTSISLNANIPNTSGLTYFWSTGDTTKIVTISKPTFLTVTNTDKNGCFATATDAVVDNRPSVNLGPDLTVCQNSVVAALDAQNPGAVYAWKINGVASSITEFQAVDVTSAGIFKYSVTVTDPITTCQITAQKTFTVIASPTFSMTGTNPSTCLATDGTISLNAITSPNLYSYFVSGPSFNKQDIDQSAAIQGPFAGLGSGTYSATITDQVSGCAVSHSFGISFPAFAVTPSVVNSCDPPTVKITTTAVAPWTYTITNGTTGAATSGGPIASSPLQIVLPSQGAGVTNTYTVQVKDVSGCVVTSNVLTIATSSLPKTTITPDLCSNLATLTAAVAGGGSNFNWSGPGIVGTTTAPKISINAGGTYTVTATATAGGCTVTQSITINYNGPIIPTFTQSDPCQNQAVLIASPLGNYTYRWYENGAVAPTQIGQQIPLTTADNGASFILEVVDAQSGCSLKTASKTVQVVGQITASLTSSLACDNGKSFTLTANTNAVGPTYTWYLNGTTVAGASASTLQQTSAGTYQVDVILATCKASASIQILKAPIPHGALPKVAIICSDPDNKNPSTSKVDLDPGYFSAYNWFKNEILLSPPYTSRVYTAESPGTYKVGLTNTYGCTNSDSTLVKNDCEPFVSAPSAFRPASTHADNKTFRVFSFFITDNFEVVIYNRWGEIVFESTDRNFHWNGGYKNSAAQPLPGDTYVYLVRYISSFHPEEGIKELRGGVVLLR